MMDGCDRIKKEKKTATKRWCKLNDYNGKKQLVLKQIESTTVALATITIKRDRRRNSNNFNTKTNMIRLRCTHWSSCTRLQMKNTNNNMKRKVKKQKNVMYFMP